MTFKLPRAIYLLSLCNGYLFINQSLLITISALIGFELADDKRLATLPMAIQFAAIMFTTVPASLFMGKFGRQNGFLLANIVGISGALIALYSVFNHSLEGFCLATLCFGVFAAFSNYYRFTAAELVGRDLKSVAISWVMAGGVLAALVLLGISWNFLYVGGTTLLTDAHTVAEKSRTQAANDLIVFTTVTLTALSSGALHHEFGWRVINLSVLPLYAVTAAVIAWLYLLKKRQVLTTPSS